MENTTNIDQEINDLLEIQKIAELAEIQGKMLVKQNDAEELDVPVFDEFYGGTRYKSYIEEDIQTKGAKKPVLKDPKGGLTAAGRAHFKRTEGANLKPGVKGPADTPEKMRRKGSFLTRFFTNPRGPMKDDKGRATRLALSAAAWGEPVPQNMEDAAKLAAKGRRLLERYDKQKKKASKKKR